MNTQMPVRSKMTLERTFKASLQDVWDLWTTKSGIESWWGPEGFTVTVDAIDLRAGGKLNYTMTATGAQQRAFMEQAGMPVSTPVTLTYTEVTPPSRLCYITLADFVPGMAPYEVATQIELSSTPAGTRMVLRFDAMHDAVWTNRAVLGHESQLRKLEAEISRRSAA